MLLAVQIQQLSVMDRSPLSSAGFGVCVFLLYMSEFSFNLRVILLSTLKMFTLFMQEGLKLLSLYGNS